MKLGIIGGSGLYQFPGFEQTGSVKLSTPFGSPSDEYIQGRLRDHPVCFLPRHGQGHRLLPSEINHRANIYGFKQLGVSRIIGITAVGSLRDEVRPRDILLPDQYFDRTKNESGHTFFGRGAVAHVSLADPVCPDLRQCLHEAAQTAVRLRPEHADVQVHVGGTYVNMEGPAFSTRAESEYYRKCGFAVIGMTSLPEAKLCREAEICYAPLAMVTDYDCWHEAREPVTAEMVLHHVLANAELAREIISRVIDRVAEPENCPCPRALDGAVMTPPEVIPVQTIEMLGPLLERWLTSRRRSARPGSPAGRRGIDLKNKPRG